MFLYTKAELKVMRQQALTDLLDHAGGRTHLARMLGKPVNTVNSWMDRRSVSIEGAKLIARHPTLAKEFPLRRIRPDYEEGMDDL